MGIGNKCLLIISKYFWHCFGKLEIESNTQKKTNKKNKTKKKKVTQKVEIRNNHRDYSETVNH